MGQCRNCGNKGFFLATDQNGLCAYCQRTVLVVVKQNARLIEDSIRLVEEGKTPGTRLSRCDLLLERAEQLLQYEKKGIPTVSPAPSQLITKYRLRRDEIVSEEILAVVEKATEKARIASSPRAKVSTLNNALLKIREIGKGFGDRSHLESHETALRGLAHKAQLEGYLDEARKAEFKGNLKRAIDQYKEALYFLKNDDVADDIQQSEISEVEAKIRNLTDPGQANPTGV
jgi:hypothetical protein